MDVKLLTQTGDYGINGVQAGTVLFQFLPEEQGLVLLILQGLLEITSCPHARAEFEKLIAILDPSAHPDRSMMN